MTTYSGGYTPATFLAALERRLFGAKFMVGEFPVVFRLTPMDVGQLPRFGQRHMEEHFVHLYLSKVLMDDPLQWGSAWEQMTTEFRRQIELLARRYPTDDSTVQWKGMWRNLTWAQLEDPKVKPTGFGVAYHNGVERDRQDEVCLVTGMVAIIPANLRGIYSGT